MASSIKTRFGQKPGTKSYQAQVRIQDFEPLTRTLRNKADAVQ